MMTGMPEEIRPPPSSVSPITPFGVTYELAEIDGQPRLPDIPSALL
jgi:hypothetical protein